MAALMPPAAATECESTGCTLLNSATDAPASAAARAARWPARPAPMMRTSCAGMPLRVYLSGFPDGGGGARPGHRGGRVRGVCALSEPMRRQERRPPDVALADLARRQWGVVSLAQLGALGIGARAAQRRAQAGKLRRIHR